MTCPGVGNGYEGKPRYTCVRVDREVERVADRVRRGEESSGGAAATQGRVYKRYR